MMPYGMTNDTPQANPCGVFFLGYTTASSLCPVQTFFIAVNCMSVPGTGRGESITEKRQMEPEVPGDVHTHFFAASDVSACIGAEEISA